MNDDFERRLRRFGSTVDRAAEAAQQRAAGASEPGDLENVVSLASRRRPYRVIATVAASAAALIGVVVFTARGGSDGDSVDPAGSGDGPALVVESSEPSASSEVVETPSPSTTAAVVTSTRPEPATSTTSAAPTSTSRPPATTRAPVCPTYRHNDGPVLRLCDQSEAVRQVQVALGINADGLFGPGTQAAVEQFQRDHGLEVDGLVGPATWAALFPGAASTTTT